MHASLVTREKAIITATTRHTMSALDFICNFFGVLWAVV